MSELGALSMIGGYCAALFLFSIISIEVQRRRAPRARILTSFSDGVVVLTASARSLSPEVCRDLYFMVVDLLRHGKKNLLLDLSQVTEINATAFFALRTAQLEAQQQGGDLRLAHPPGQLELDEWIKQLLWMFNTIEQALKSFSQPSAEQEQVEHPARQG